MQKPTVDASMPIEQPPPPAGSPKICAEEHRKVMMGGFGEGWAGRGGLTYSMRRRRDAHLDGPSSSATCRHVTHACASRRESQHVERVRKREATRCRSSLTQRGPGCRSSQLAPKSSSRTSRDSDARGGADSCLFTKNEIGSRSTELQSRVTAVDDRVGLRPRLPVERAPRDLSGAMRATYWDQRTAEQSLRQQKSVSDTLARYEG